MYDIRTQTHLLNKKESIVGFGPTRGGYPYSFADCRLRPDSTHID